MVEYRAYFIDKSGWFLDVQQVEAGSDDEVNAAVREALSDGFCEIWEDRRLVAKIEADSD